MTNASANISAPTLGLFERLSVRLVMLFAVTFAIAFLALWVYGISVSYLESAVAEQAIVQPKPIVIDPKLRDELAAIMSLGSSTEPPAIRDPFNDRTGLAGLSTLQRAGGAGTVTTTGGTGGSGRTSTVLAAGQPGRSSGNPGGGTSGGSSGSQGQQVSASEGTKQRYDAWLSRAAMGDIRLDPRVFAVDDLLPVGVVDGGNGQQEVLFFSEAAGRTISFPVGTAFYDGWLTELRPEGVVFSSSDEKRTVKLRSWARSVRNLG